MGHTLAEARAHAKAAQGRDRRQRDSPTVEEWLAEWLDSAKDRLDPQTWLPYEQHARLHIVPALGNVRLTALSADHIEKLHRQTRAKVGPSTAHHVHATLSSALAVAQKRGLVRSNVAKEVAPPRRAASDIQPYSPEQVRAILRASHGHPLEALFTLAVTLGPRQGELLGLRWRHVDLDGGHIRIVSNVTSSYDGGLVLAEPKTPASNRTLHPLPNVVVDAFRRTVVTADELVWPAPKKGGPRMATTINKAWKRLAQKAGVPHTTFHNLRHTAATIMLDDGVPPHVVSAILGHASVGITLQLYAHVTRSGLGAAATVLNARYDQPPAAL